MKTHHWGRPGWVARLVPARFRAGSGPNRWDVRRSAPRRIAHTSQGRSELRHEQPILHGVDWRYRGLTQRHYRSRPRPRIGTVSTAGCERP
jgi:hypothetical protein